jgi:peptide/nickel transport system ATP-binding protein
MKLKLNVPLCYLGKECDSVAKFLIVEDLNTHYITEKGNVHAVEDVSFDLDDGESIGIAGESACGKSTLGLSMIRMVPGGKIISGKIMIDGDSILELSEKEFDKKQRWKKVSMVFQGAMNSLDPVFTVSQQLSNVLKQHDFDGSYSDTMKSAVRSVGLNEDVLQKYPHELSGGMKQRVVIAMALLLKPKIMIADEPTTALDVLVQAQILNLLKGLKKEGMSIMLISHDLSTISEVCEKIGIMYGGKMIEFGTSCEIFEKPKHPYTQALIQSIPRLYGTEKPKYIPGSPPNLLAPKHGCRFIDRCPHMMEKCKTDPPKFKTESGYVLCWLYE